jgi:HlyD family secretion protein
MNSARKPGANHRARRWVPYLGAVVLAGLVTGGLWPKPVPIETARVTVGALRVTVNEEGKTRIKQRYVVCAPVVGQLRRIPFKAGAEVAAGDTVAVIEPVSPTLLDVRARASSEAKRDTAAANVEKARAAHTFATSDLKRTEKLHADKTVSVQELENAQWREASAAKEEAAAESALRQAEAELAEFMPSTLGATNAPYQPQEVKAPIRGRVLRVQEENARVVLMGTPLLEIGDPTDLEVVIEVLSRDGAAVAPGSKVEFEQWGRPDAPPLLGQVRLVEPAAFTKISALGVEEQRVNVVADLLTPPEERRNVGDNFRVEAKIILWEATNAVKAPAGALFRHGEQWAAFVVANGRAELRVVKAGRSNGIEMQVLEGLREGEEVAIYPGSRVRQGQRVRTIKI